MFGITNNQLSMLVFLTPSTLSPSLFRHLKSPTTILKLFEFIGDLRWRDPLQDFLVSETYAH